MKTQELVKYLSFIITYGYLSQGLTSCDRQEAVSSDNWATLKTGFKDPKAEYRTVPSAVWNGKMTKGEVERAIQELEDARSGGAFIHPHPGLIAGYMSDEQYSLYRYAVDYGKKNDMNIWIYDENSYPGDFADGHVPELMPGFYNQGQGLALRKIELLPEKLDNYFTRLKKGGDKQKGITSKIDSYKQRKGEYYLYEKTFCGHSDWYGGCSYVDVMVKGVTKKFVDITMQSYEKVAKSEFGKTIPGTFTDEPSIQSSGGLRWTPDLFDVFQ